MAPRLDIVIVNWNAGDFLRRCLASLPAARVDGVCVGRVAVVDNASTDGSADRLPDVPGLAVQRNPHNRGFAAACNQGAAGSTADYLLFLNPDTELRSDSLAPAVAYLEAHPQAGAAGARLIDALGRTQRSCARFPTPGRLIAQAVGLDRAAPRLFPPHFMTEWDHADTRAVDQVMGAFLLVRRPLFETLCGFDERFFVYFEDVDLCLRIRRAGLSVVHVADAVVVHAGCGTTDGVRDTRLFYVLRSRIRYAAKHFSPPAAALVTAATLTLEPVARLALAVLRRSPADMATTLRGTARLWRALFSQQA